VLSVLVVLPGELGLDVDVDCARLRAVVAGGASSLKSEIVRLITVDSTLTTWEKEGMGHGVAESREIEKLDGSTLNH
jgi:hypothetical protein